MARETLSDLQDPEGAAPPISNGAKLPPLRVLPQLVAGVLVVDIGVAQRLLNKPDQVSRLLIGKPKGKPAPLASVVGEQLQLVEPNAETELERLTDSFHLNLTAFGLLSFFVGLFIVNSAVGLAFEQRLPMLRTLRACGASARLVNTVLVVELVALALVAGLIGLVCGYFIAAALLPDVAASLRGLYGAQIPGQRRGEHGLGPHAPSHATARRRRAARRPAAAAAPGRARSPRPPRRHPRPPSRRRSRAGGDSLRVDRDSSLPVTGASAAEYAYWSASTMMPRFLAVSMSASALALAPQRLGLSTLR